MIEVAVPLVFGEIVCGVSEERGGVEPEGYKQGEGRQAYVLTLALSFLKFHYTSFPWLRFLITGANGDEGGWGSHSLTVAEGGSVVAGNWNYLRDIARSHAIK